MPQLPFKWPPVTQLVAVLCIVGFLTLVLYPLLHPSGEPIRRASCLSNLKQLGLAYVQYSYDSDSVLPSGVNAAGNGWAGQLYPYAKSIGVYHCPDDGHDGAFISYAENQNLVRLPLKKLAEPATTVEGYEFSTLNCNPSTPETVSATGTSAPQNSTRHNSDFGLNFLLADGHVQWLLPAQVSNGPGAVRPKTLPSGKMIRTFAVR